MKLFYLKFGKLEVPLFDIGALASGFYIGYAEGKGLDTTETAEYLFKYGPTALAVTAAPILIKATNAAEKWGHSVLSNSLQSGNLEVTLPDGSKKEYRNLDQREREEETPKIIEGINNLESHLQDAKYLRPTLTVGAKTAIETTVGYVAGRIYSQFF